MHALVRPHLAHVVRLPDEVGRAIENRDEVCGDGRLAVVGKRHLDAVAAALRGWVDHRVVDVAQRALGERRERADALDLVAEELDPKWLSARRREDVDDPAAHGEVAALLDAVDALVARERERFGKRVDPRFISRRDAQRGGPNGRRRDGLGERERRGADEPAGLEQLERTRTLADEVRRRLEPRAPANAAGGQQPDAFLADEPGGGLGDVARVGVFGQENAEPAAGLFVQRGEQERQRRLGHARPRRQRRRKRGQAGICAQALDERIEDRTVHDERPGVAPGGTSQY